MQPSRMAPALSVDQWFNTESPIDLESLRGRVTVIYAFQLLCPGCVQHSIPQAKQLHAAFNPEQVNVLGLHTVFEHHEAMTPQVLSVFIKENKLVFPIGVDATRPGRSIPQTMHAYDMQGTPTVLMIDRESRLRVQYFGHLHDLQVAAKLTDLLTEQPARP